MDISKEPFNHLEEEYTELASMLKNDPERHADLIRRTEIAQSLWHTASAIAGTVAEYYRSLNKRTRRKPYKVKDIRVILKPLKY